MELKYVGGVYGGSVKPAPFLCLILKMLQIQPVKDIIVEFISQPDFKYVVIFEVSVSVLVTQRCVCVCIVLSTVRRYISHVITLIDMRPINNVNKYIRFCILFMSGSVQQRNCWWMNSKYYIL